MASLTRVCDHEASPNPRADGMCVKCARVIPQAERPRDPAREAEIVQLAVQSLHGHLDDEGLSKFANDRAWDGGVRVGENWLRHAKEEIADARHYLVWHIEDHWAAHQAGDSDATDEVVAALASLADLIRIWARHR